MKRLTHYRVDTGSHHQVGSICNSRILYVQWDLSIKDTLNKGHLSNEDTVHSLNHIEPCTKLRTSELGTPLHTGQPTRWCPL